MVSINEIQSLNNSSLWLEKVSGEKVTTKAKLLVDILTKLEWQTDSKIYNVASALFCDVVRAPLDDKDKKALKSQIKEIKKLFSQFQEKEMPKDYQSERKDKDHHNGSQVKKLVEKGKNTKKNLEKIPQVKYAGRTLRAETWTSFRDSGTIRKKGFSRGSSDNQSRIFVMDRFGQFYLSKDISGNARSGEKAIKHSTFFNGRKVAAAGKITCNKKGEVVKITNESGHYRPGEFEMDQVKVALQRHGVKVDGIKVEIRR